MSQAINKSVHPYLKYSQKASDMYRKRFIFLRSALRSAAVCGTALLPSSASSISSSSSSSSSSSFKSGCVSSPSIFANVPCCVGALDVELNGFDPRDPSESAVESVDTSESLRSALLVCILLSTGAESGRSIVGVD